MRIRCMLYFIYLFHITREAWTVFTFGQSIWKKRLGLDEACKPQKKNDFGKFANRSLIEEKLIVWSQSYKKKCTLIKSKLVFNSLMMD